MSRSFTVRVALGAAAGAAATVAMSGVMLASYASGRVRKVAPEAITDAALDEVGGASAPVEKAATVAGHFAYGTANGVLFSLAAPHLPGRGVTKGVLFGLVLLVVSYGGWVPAVGILPPLDEQKRARFATLTLAHLVYGAVLGWAAGVRA